MVSCEVKKNGVRKKKQEALELAKRLGSECYRTQDHVMSSMEANVIPSNPLEQSVGSKPLLGGNLGDAQGGKETYRSMVSDVRRWPEYENETRQWPPISTNVVWKKGTKPLLLF
ncbi:hypothetical protein L6452_26944 [Arctium lappa]|uniref:Uncharacterized protein n=1 Tax=Arctium lappa TaxID=4217 RepID=A0ACB8ZWC6_ARCLA|nr:hypothetical protein L6452_26944 [Arctium lappa]